MELPEAEVAVGDERTQAAPLGERERLPIVFPGGLVRVGRVGLRRDVAQQVPRLSRKAAIVTGGREHSLGQSTSIIEPAQPKAGTTEERKRPREVPDETLGEETLDDVFSFADALGGAD